MLIRPEHYRAIEAAVKPLDTEERRNAYRTQRAESIAEFPASENMRYRWDLLWASKLKLGDGVGMSGLPVYEYANDNHIDTALRRMVAPL